MVHLAYMYGNKTFYLLELEVFTFYICIHSVVSSSLGVVGFSCCRHLKFQLPITQTKRDERCANNYKLKSGRAHAIIVSGVGMSPDTREVGSNPCF